MYRRHKIQAVITAIAVFITGFSLKVRFSCLAEAALTVISIAFAVYVAVATTLLGSAFSRSLKKMVDSENPTKSMLGVLASYLRSAGICGVLAIIICSLYLLEPDLTFVQSILKDNYSMFLRFASALSSAAFSLCVFFMCLIMEFLITALLNATALKERDLEEKLGDRINKQIIRKADGK